MPLKYFEVYFDINRSGLGVSCKFQVIAEETSEPIFEWHSRLIEQLPLLDAKLFYLLVPVIDIDHGCVIFIVGKLFDKAINEASETLDVFSASIVNLLFSENFIGRSIFVEIVVFILFTFVFKNLCRLSFGVFAINNDLHRQINDVFQLLSQSFLVKSLQHDLVDVWQYISLIAGVLPNLVRRRPFLKLILEVIQRLHVSLDQYKVEALIR